MKSFLLAAYLLGSLSTLAQTTPMPAVGVEVTTPFKGANVLLLHTTDSASTALKNLGRLLVKNGYSIDKLDLQLGYLTTADPTVAAGHTTYDYKAVADPEKGGTVLSISGRYTTVTGFAAVVSGPVAYGKGNAGKGFTAIEPVAQAYPNSRVGYAHDGKPGTKTTIPGTKTTIIGK
jgi:hypothetical protein